MDPLPFLVLSLCPLYIKRSLDLSIVEPAVLGMHDSLLTFIVSRWWRLGPLFVPCIALSIVSGFLLKGADVMQLASNYVSWLRRLLIAGSNFPGHNGSYLARRQRSWRITFLGATKPLDFVRIWGVDRDNGTQRFN